ncbi:hypothetical protein J2799_001335 [Chryseobacterium vietnamense]|nr:hypothetical protein [Chryseobacterium vietnamense]
MYSANHKMFFSKLRMKEIWKVSGLFYKQKVLRNRYNVFGWKILNIGDSKEVNTLFWGYFKNPIIYIMLNCIFF